MNGGQGAEVEGTWSASLEWLVNRLAPLFPALEFAEVRYRIKSWNKLDWCIDDARSAVESIGATRTLLVGFSMGGAVASRVAAEPSVQTVVGLAPWFPDRLPLDALRGRRLRVLHGSLDRWLPGIPGVSPATAPALSASRASTRSFRERCTDSHCEPTGTLWRCHAHARGRDSSPTSCGGSRLRLRRAERAAARAARGRAP
jgi:pimeloyl-ACP methyl ester carboxylesterase